MSRKRMAARWQWEEFGDWSDYSARDSQLLEQAFQGGAPCQYLENGKYCVTFFTSKNKQHTQQNIFSGFQRNVRRLDSTPSTLPSSSAQHQAHTAILLLDSDEEEDDLPPVKKKKQKHAPKAPPSPTQTDDEGMALYPDASESSPVWDYIDPKTKQWTVLPGSLPRMVEGLSKRSGVFTIQIPGLSGYRVVLATMTMESVNEELSTQIRRTPALKSTSASPIIAPVSAANASSSSSTTKSKKKASHEENEFEVPPGLMSKCRKATDWKELSKQEVKELKDSKCVICFDDVSDSRPVVHLSQCGPHYFHANCIAASFKPGFVSCPVCQTIYGTRTGTQPNGTMKVSETSDRLPGYESYGSIRIAYSFRDGIQGAHHPSPGSPYSGTSRIAYLPNCPEGQKVLKLLEIAFSRQLVFTIGTSVTTGMPNCVIWNGIHHKTNITGGSSNFGYPDPTYLARVTEELKAKGVSLS